MREIKFRGKRVDNGEWVYGYYSPDMLERTHRHVTWAFIREYDYKNNKITVHQVKKETVGQYTGLTDKNGKMIFEGDIYDAPLDFGPGGFSIRRGVVVWDNESGYNWHYWKVADLEVIGNIYENPELLEVN